MFDLKKYSRNTWILSHPRFLYRILKGFCRAFLFRKDTLRLVELFPTFECQLSCQMCSVAKYKARERKMELADYQHLARAAAREGAWIMTVLGGEPLIYKNISDLINIFHRQNYFTHIVSNGLLVSRALLVELKRAGLNAFYLSLESLSPEANDVIRGKDSYEKVMEGIRYSKELGLITGICTVIIPGQLERAKEVIDFCHQNGLNASGGQIAPVGNAEGRLVLSEVEFAQVRQLLKQYPRLTYDWVFSYFLKPRCPGGREKIGVTCYGDVIPCSYNPLSFGNIFNESLAVILSRMKMFSMFSKDYPGCLTAENHDYIEHYLKPIYQADTYPVHFTQHPSISSDNEPKLFS